MSSVGFGNPYLKKQPVETTASAEALLTSDPEKSRTFWFMYDREVGVAAMGRHEAPQADLCRLVCRFKDKIGFRSEVCKNLRYISVASGKHPVSLRIIGVGAPPDVSIPRYLFDPVRWVQLPWNGASCIFEPGDAHRLMLQKAQELLISSPLAPFYCAVDPKCLCLNTYRLLDPHRRGELLGSIEDADNVSWDACNNIIQQRLSPLILASAPWTYWPLKFERADVTSITLSPIGPGGKDVVDNWAKQVQLATGLPNHATSRESMTISFAFQVFPVEGDNVSQVRRELVRQITALFESEWGVAEFRDPKIASWNTHVHYSYLQD